MISESRAWTRDSVIAAIRQHEEQGTDLAFSPMRDLHPLLVSAARRHFGNWRRAVMAAGFDYDRMRHAGKERRAYEMTKWTPDTILETVRRLAELGEDFRASAVAIRQPGLYGAAVAHFRSWDTVLEAAGIRPELILASFRAYRGWKRRWLERLKAQAAGLESDRVRVGRDWARAFDMPGVDRDTDWLSQLAWDKQRLDIAHDGQAPENSG